MKIIVDAFGGDNAPFSVLEGCVAAKKEYEVEIAEWHRILDELDNIGGEEDD